jgi:uracil-DNA glycosylase family 4
MATPGEAELRTRRLDEPHVRPLTDYVRRLVAERPEREIPWVDPESGGVGAHVLLLARSPAPGAVGSNGSGFISLDNDEAGAETLLMATEEAGMERAELVLWNVVPWALGNRKPTAQELEEARPFLRRFVSLLDRPRAVVLLGDVAERAWDRARIDIPARRAVFTAPSASPPGINRPGARDQLLEALRAAWRMAAG